jgi:hypothetical protein
MFKRIRYISLLGLLFFSSLSFAKGGEVSILEILFLKKGKTHEEAQLYFYNMSQVAERYGVTEGAAAQVKRWLKGGRGGVYNADYVVVSTFPSQRAMNDMIQKDKDYEGLLLTRDELFDAGETIVFQVDVLKAPE